jgi:predicted glycoside hydrolase/deacetylase ChbG (UPF0249 family)
LPVCSVYDTEARAERAPERPREMTPPRIDLITRGDDCGSNDTANAAILAAFKTGMLKNTSIMAPCEAVGGAAKMLAGEPDLCCGLHATITAEWDQIRWGPVLPPDRVPSLADDRGHFFQTTRALRANAPRLSEIMAELQAQLDLLRDWGFDIRYADQHMGFGGVAEGLPEAFDEWCERQGLRSSRHYVQRLPQVDAGTDQVDRLIAQLEAAEPGQYLVVGHPAYDTQEMRALGHEGSPGSWVAPDRDGQRRMFMDPRILDYCQEHGVIPIRYDEARRLR